MYKSPCGDLLLGAIDDKICLCDWMVEGRIERTLRRIGRYLPSESRDDETILQKAVRQLDEYFQGKLQTFELPLMFGASEFQKSVWEMLRSIPYGATISYGEISKKLGNPSGVRAVANAIGANPLSIIVPCHRVIGRDGGLTGYAGGLEAKKYLLDLES